MGKGDKGSKKPSTGAQKRGTQAPDGNRRPVIKESGTRSGDSGKLKPDTGSGTRRVKE